jgi:superfamily I DNA and/or RNA helicase
MSMRGRNRVTANQIGIITPYRRQVQRIRTLLTGRYPSVQVGGPRAWWLHRHRQV